MAQMSREEMLAQARAQMERVSTILKGIACVRAARDVAKDGLSEGGEMIAMVTLIKAEEGLVDQVIAPEFGEYLSLLQASLAELLRPQIAARGILS